MKIIRPPPRAGWGTAGRVSAVLQVILLYAEVYFWQRNESLIRQFSDLKIVLKLVFLQLLGQPVLL